MQNTKIIPPLHIHLNFEKSSPHPIMLTEQIKKHYYQHKFNQLNLFITIESNVQITLIDILQSLQLSCISITIKLGSNSTLIYHNRVIESDRPIELIRSNITEKQSKLKAVVTKQSATIYSYEKKLHFILAGTKAHATIQSTYFAGQSKQFKLTTIQEHVAKRSKSTMVIKGVFKENAQFFSDNLIKINKNATHSYAHQVTKNLLLSNCAQVITLPKIEVKTNEVNCTHGAATSTIDKEHLTYLQSRCFYPAQAKDFLIKAFLSY